MILDPISLYCARTVPGPWVELYSLTASLIFIPAGLQVMGWGRNRPVLRWLGLLMILISLTLIWLHTYPSIPPVALISLFSFVITMILFFVINRHVLEKSLVLSLVLTGMILPFTAIGLTVVPLVPGVGSTAAYGGFLIMVLGYAAILRREVPATARRLFAAGLTLAFAMLARAADSAVCDSFPQGTHFLWLLGSATSLWLMSRLYHLHLLEHPGGNAGQGGLAGQGGGR